MYVRASSLCSSNFHLHLSSPLKHLYEAVSEFVGLCLSRRMLFLSAPFDKLISTLVLDDFQVAACPPLYVRCVYLFALYWIDPIEKEEEGMGGEKL